MERLKDCTGVGVGYRGEIKNVRMNTRLTCSFPPTSLILSPPPPGGSDVFGKLWLIQLVRTRPPRLGEGNSRAFGNARG